MNATVFVVTDRQGANGDRGRIVQSQEIFGDTKCEEAYLDVYDDPISILNDVVGNVRNVRTGDGNFGAAKKYQAAIDDAREAGIKEIITTSRD